MILNFIAQIKEARQAAGLTQAQMSARVGCSLPAYQSIELGRRTPSLAMFVNIVKTLNGAIHINLPTGKREPTPPEKESRPHRKKRADPTRKREPTPPEKESRPHQKKRPARTKNRK